MPGRIRSCSLISLAEATWYQLCLSSHCPWWLQDFGGGAGRTPRGTCSDGAVGLINEFHASTPSLTLCSPVLCCPRALRAVLRGLWPGSCWHLPAGDIWTQQPREDDSRKHHQAFSELAIPALHGEGPWREGVSPGQFHFHHYFCSWLLPMFPVFSHEPGPAFPGVRHMHSSFCFSEFCRIKCL